MIKSSQLSSVDSIKHAFFTREDGVSGGVFAGLNCGYGSGDETANIDQNRTVAMAKLGLRRENLNTIYQIHSAHVVVADEAWSLDARPKADGIVTQTPDLAIGVMSADCTPVLFADHHASIIGAAHAGWKGALGGVLANTVSKMVEMGAERSQIAAAVGPCIHQESYEVGPEFRQSFMTEDEGFSAYFIASERDDHYLFDLPKFVVDRLQVLGLASVENVSVDTYADEQRFFSYRRATHRKEADYGRGLSAIAISKD